MGKEEKPVKQNCKIIAVANQKGGVGKTTTAENIGIGLSKQDKKVLLVDFDPQGDLTACLGWKNNDALEHTVAELLDKTIRDEDFNLSDLILSHKEDVDLIPSNIELADFEMKLVGVINRERILDTCLKPFRKRYDYILIDCPPSLGMLTINALTASDEVLIPVQAQYLPAKGMTKLISTVNKVQRLINPNLKIAGVAITLADMRTNLAKSTVETLHDNFGEHIRIFKSVIPVAIKASEATITGKSIYTYAEDSKVAKAYQDLTKEIISHGQPKSKNEYMR